MDDSSSYCGGHQWEASNHAFCLDFTPVSFQKPENILGVRRLQHAPTSCKCEQKRHKKGGLHITIECTCKLSVPISSATKPGDYFPVWLEDKHAARLVIHHDDVPVAVHRNSFGPHQLSRSDFCLLEASTADKIKTLYRTRRQTFFLVNLHLNV